MRIIQQLADFKKQHQNTEIELQKQRKNNIYINNIKSDIYIK